MIGKKIAAQFESRTAIMVKNRFYHIKKKNILEKLLEEVELPDSSSESLSQEIPRDEDERESFQFFIQKGDQLLSKTLNIPNIDMFFECKGMDQEAQLFETITPMSANRIEYRYEEEDIYSLTSFLGGNNRNIYY